MEYTKLILCGWWDLCWLNRLLIIWTRTRTSPIYDKAVCTSILRTVTRTPGHRRVIWLSFINSSHLLGLGLQTELLQSSPRHIIAAKATDCHPRMLVLTLEVISDRKETSCLPLLNAGFESRVSGTESPTSRQNVRWQTGYRGSS